MSVLKGFNADFIFVSAGYRVINKLRMRNVLSYSTRISVTGTKRSQIGEAGRRKRKQAQR